MRIGILGQFTDPNDPVVSKAGYRHVIGLAKLLSEDNEVTLYPLHRRRLSLDLPECRVMPIYSANPLMRWLKLTGELIKERRQHDVFIIHNPTVFAFPVMPLRILLPFPIVVEYLDRQTTPTYSRYKILRQLGFFSERLFLLTIDNWLTDSTELENTIRRARKKSNILIYRTMLSSPSPSGKEPTSLPLAIEADKINIAYTGALHYDHGVDILIDAFGELSPDNLHLYITGFGPMKPLLEGKVRNKNLSNVTITFLDSELMDSFLSRMDILVIPYRNTKIMRMVGFPSKILNYMQAGKAIIVTSVGELPELLENGKTAILIEPDSQPALRGALTDLIIDSEKRRRLGLSARRYFADNFSQQVVKPKINHYLNDIVNP